jgi:excisionase family DNA binding protein
MKPLLLAIDDRLAQLLVAGLLLGRRELRRAGTPTSSDYDAIVGVLHRTPWAQVPPSAPEWTRFDDPNPRAEPEFISVRQAAEEMGLSEKTIRRLVASGRLPSARAGRRILIPVAGVREFGGQRAG